MVDGQNFKQFTRHIGRTHSEGTITKAFKKASKPCGSDRNVIASVFFVNLMFFLTCPCSLVTNARVVHT